MAKKKGRPRRMLDDSTYASRLAVRVRELMDKNGLTPLALSEKLSGEGYPVGKSTIEAWLSGRNKVDLNAIPALAEIFGLKPRSVFPDR